MNLQNCWGLGMQNDVMVLRLTDIYSHSVLDLAAASVQRQYRFVTPLDFESGQGEVG